jgi:hypothetical protein
MDTGVGEALAEIATSPSTKVHGKLPLSNMPKATEHFEDLDQNQFNLSRT